MKAKIKALYLGNLEGEKSKGGKWNALKVQDENLNQFLIFGDRAKDYLGTTIGDKLELEIEINTKMNYVTKRTEISLNM